MRSPHGPDDESLPHLSVKSMQQSSTQTGTISMKIVSVSVSVSVIAVDAVTYSGSPNRP